jgi:16S rRNA (cytosine967-C5)-methyltransferase
MAEADMPADARVCAYAVLRRVFEQGAYADRALRAQAQAMDLDARDHALARRIAYGAIQRRGTLDYLIERLAERSVHRLDPPVLAALRLGAYELLYTAGAPDHAVVADAVELAKTNARAGHGLVNAVLRRATREGAGLLAELRDDTPEQAAIKHSHPEWIAHMWWQELGADEARALLAADNEPGELALRANTLLTDAKHLAEELLPVATHLDPDIPEAIVLDERARFDASASPAWQRGELTGQSRAAMLVSRTLAPEPGERVLDLCAAPGGKTTHIAALMNGTGTVVAVERDRSRAGALTRNVKRMRAENVHVELADATQPRGDEAAFDRVLVDPPCSGLGTLQARPDLRWRKHPTNLHELTRVQARILAAAAQALRPGGVLVYSTCTISATENERQIATFLDTVDDFALDDLTTVEPSGLGRPAPGMREAVLTLPHRDRTAGFFIARLRRNG